MHWRRNSHQGLLPVATQALWACQGAGRMVSMERMGRTLAWVCGVACAVAACVWDDIPRSASGAPCEEAEDCPTVVCTCASGADLTVIACVNRHCQTQQDACPTACEDFGGWEHREPHQTFCATGADCPEVACHCASGVDLTQGACLQGFCAEEGDGCDHICRHEGGWTGCSPEDPSCGER